MLVSVRPVGLDLQLVQGLDQDPDQVQGHRGGQSQDQAREQDQEVDPGQGQELGQEADHVQDQNQEVDLALGLVLGVSCISDVCFNTMYRGPYHSAFRGIIPLLESPFRDSARY
ncbi:hypothetical protein RRG08_047841 [Elysia crispata]|uniref:Uncharacterized protein n=1 Tax=Elysia crispata TaxID=231223 RepID=A0AAE0ZYE3_9GAST|nr:hypothetical protein RRG08_047841 [Elysia crispata]